MLFGDLRRPRVPSMRTGSVGVWIARVQWSSSNVRWRPERSSNPSYPRFRGIVHQFVSTPVEPSDRVKARDSRLVWGMDPLGFEPRASSLQRRCSTAELRARLALVVLRCLSGVGESVHDDGPTRTRMRCERERVMRVDCSVGAFHGCAATAVGQARRPGPGL